MLILQKKQDIRPLPPSLVQSLGLSGPAYLDVVNNSAGYPHIALFSPADSGTPIFLTDGDWEVTGGILGIDDNGVVLVLAFAYCLTIADNVASDILLLHIRLPSKGPFLLPLWHRSLLMVPKHCRS